MQKETYLAVLMFQCLKMFTEAVAVTNFMMIMILKPDDSRLVV